MSMVDERVDQLLHQRIARLEITGDASRREIQAIRQMQTENSGYLQQILHRFDTRPIQDSPTATQAPQFTMDFRENVFLMIPPNMASAMQTGLYNIVSEDRYIERECAVRVTNCEAAGLIELTDYGLWPETNRIMRSITPVLATPVTRDELARILRIQETDPPAETDLKYVLRRANSMQQRGLGQARSLMDKVAFKNLLAEEASGMLMVDGHCREDGDGKTSPLSFWAASLAASLMQSDSVFVLHYFCGLHSRNSADGPPAGPLGLIKSLVEQLVRHAGESFSRMGPLDKALAQEITDDNFEAILSLFRPLLLNLDSSKNVFVIIDNASEFEGVTWNEWSEQMLQIFKTLYDMVRGQTPGSRSEMQLKMKVLMTNANKSTVLGRLVEDGEIISLF